MNLESAVQLLSGAAYAVSLLLAAGVVFGASALVDALPALTGQSGRERSYLDCRGAVL